MGLSLRTEQRPEHRLLIINLKPLCEIVRLLENKDEGFNGHDVSRSIGDFYSKHPGDSLHYRVSDLYLGGSLGSPNSYIAFWSRLNPNIVKIASLCLEKGVSQEDTEAIGASLVIASNLLSVYDGSLQILKEKTGTERGKAANQIASKTYSTLKDAIQKNKDYIAKNDSYCYLPGIDQMLRAIEHDLK